MNYQFDLFKEISDDLEEEILPDLEKQVLPNLEDHLPTIEELDWWNSRDKKDGLIMMTEEEREQSLLQE